MTEKQKKLQESIMLACHTWLSLDEAKRKDWDIEIYKCSHCDWTGKSKSITWWCFFCCIPYAFRDHNLPKTKPWECVRIIKKQPTLPRVLTALDNKNKYKDTWYIYRGVNQEICYVEDFGDDITTICKRKLLNNDWSDATLFDQSQETQDVLFDIICND